MLPLLFYSQPGYLLDFVIDFSQQHSCCFYCAAESQTAVFSPNSVVVIGELEVKSETKE